MSHYDTPTSRARKSKKRFEAKQKSIEDEQKRKLPKENKKNWKLCKYVKDLR